VYQISSITEYVLILGPKYLKGVFRGILKFQNSKYRLHLLIYPFRVNNENLQNYNYNYNFRKL